MNLYDLDTKITKKSYDILNNHISTQKDLDLERINEIRSNCRDILQKNGIFEDRKNGVVYELMDRELSNLERNIDYFNEYSFEEIAKEKIDLGIENISSKLESLEDGFEFVYEDDDIKYDRAQNERNIKNMVFTYFESYKNNTLDFLAQTGYSQNWLDKVEDDILEYVTSKSSDILVEKFSSDRIKGINSLKKSLNKLSTNIINEAEARYNCEVSGIVYDELKEIRNSVKTKAQKLENIRAQIEMLEEKSNEFNKKRAKADERIAL